MRISKEVQVGFFMVVTIGLLYIGFNYLRGIEFFDDTNKYYAKYANVGGLTVSNSVLISGYSVGRVSKVQILQADSNRVIVEMTIDGDIILGEGAAAMLDVGLLGEASIKVEPGDILRPLQAGDTLNSVLGVGISDIIENTLTPVASTIQSAIVRVNQILEKMIGSSGQVQNMVDNLEATTLNSKMLVMDLRKSLSDMVVSYNGVIQNVDTKINQLSPVIGKYGELADSLKSIDIQPALDAAEKTMKDLDKLLVKIEKSEGTFNALIEDKALYDNLNNTILKLDSLLEHFESRPKDFLAPLGRDRPKGKRK